MQHALPGEPRENLRNQTYHTQTFVLADAQKTAQETIRKRKPVLSILKHFSAKPHKHACNTHTQIPTTHEKPVQNTLPWQCEGIRWNRIGRYGLQHIANRQTHLKPWTISCAPWHNACSSFSSEQPHTKNWWLASWFMTCKNVRSSCYFPSLPLLACFPIFPFYNYARHSTSLSSPSPSAYLSPLQHFPNLLKAFFLLLAHGFCTFECKALLTAT